MMPRTYVREAEGRGTTERTTTTERARLVAGANRPGAWRGEVLRECLGSGPGRDGFRSRPTAAPAGCVASPSVASLEVRSPASVREMWSRPSDRVLQPAWRWPAVVVPIVLCRLFPGPRRQAPRAVARRQARTSGGAAGAHPRLPARSRVSGLRRERSDRARVRSRRGEDGEHLRPHRQHSADKNGRRRDRAMRNRLRELPPATDGHARRLAARRFAGAVEPRSRRQHGGAQHGPFARHPRRQCLCRLWPK
jgi:hypothetical protein